jgi:hypothetical protein
MYAPATLKKQCLSTKAMRERAVSIIGSSSKCLISVFFTSTKKVDTVGTNYAFQIRRSDGAQEFGVVNQRAGPLTRKHGSRGGSNPKKFERETESQNDLKHYADTASTRAGRSC